MQFFYDLAAIIYYNLRTKFGLSEITSKIQDFWEECQREIRNDNIQEVLFGIYRKNKSVYDEIERGSPNLDNIYFYIIILAAIDYYFEESNRLEEAILNDCALNEKYSDLIEIHVAYKGAFRSKMANDEYAAYFPHLLFFVKDKNIYKKCKIKNVYLSQTTDKIRVGFVPYPMPPNDILKEENGKISVVEKIGLDDLDEHFIENCREAVIEYECDVIFAPEIHGSSLTDKELRELCGENSSKVVLCPSYHHIDDTTGKKSNRASVYVWRNGHRHRLELKKYFQAKYKGGKQENFDTPDEFNYIVIHIKGFSRLGVFICKDYLADDIRNLINLLNIDVAVVQCYSDKTSDFDSEMRYNNASNHFIILGNSCDAMKKWDECVPFMYTEYDYNHSPYGALCDIKKLPCADKNCKTAKCFRILELTMEDGKIKTNLIK